MRTREALIRIVLLSLLLYSALGLASSGGELEQAQAKRELLEAKLSRLEAERQQLQAKLEQGISVEDAQQYARQRLGLVMPGEKIFYFTTDREG